MGGQLFFFLQVLRFSSTFDERSARFKWNVIERVLKPKSPSNYGVWMADYIINLWNLYQMFRFQRQFPTIRSAGCYVPARYYGLLEYHKWGPTSSFKISLLMQSLRKLQDCLTKPANFHSVLQQSSVCQTNVLWFLAKRDSNLITDKPPVLQKFIFGQVYRNGTGVIQELSKKEKFWGNFRISGRSFGPNFGFPYIFYIFLLLPQL